MASQSRRDSYVDKGEDEVEMAEREETNKRDRADTSFESVKEDDQKSPRHKKKKVSKDAEQRLYHDIIAQSKLLKAVGEENDKEIMSLIGCYTPVYRDCPDQAIEMMNKISTGWTERKKKFIKP